MKVSILASALAIVIGVACGHRDRVIYGDFAEAPGVKAGIAVLFRGVRIGEVQAVNVERGKVRVSMAIDSPDAPVRSNDQVMVVPVGLFGDVALRIQPASDSGTIVRDGAVLEGIAPPSPKNIAPADVDSATRSLRRLFAPSADSTTGRSATAKRPQRR